MILRVHFIMLFLLQYCNAATCPKKCTCFNKITRCGSKGLTDIPQSIPSQTITLQANNNLISHIPTQMLRGGRSLLELRLQNNIIEELTVNNFRNTPSLTKLDISHNNITIIPDNAFLKLNNLQTLNLSSNQISRLYPEAFKDLKSLQELILSNNKIRVIPIDLLTSIPKLTQLKLDGNRIATVPDGIFSKLPVLGILNLGRNRVRRITVGTFEGLKSLQQIYLQDNKLLSIDGHLPVPDITCDTKPVGNFSNSEVMQLQPEDGVFTKMKKLQLIDLQFNDLSTIKVSSFLGLKYLKSLTITDNDWRCNCPLKWNIESIRDYLWANGMKVWLEDIHCKEPNTIKDVNLDDLSFTDLKGVAKSLKEMNSKTTIKTNFNYGQDGNYLATLFPTRVITSDFDGNRKTTPIRPSIDLVEQTRDILSTKSPPRSLIPVLQTSAMTSTTSYALQTKDDKPYKRNLDGISHVSTTDVASNNETIKYVDIQRNDGIFPKHKEGEMVWILGTVIMVLAFFLALVGGLVARKYLNKRACCFKTKASTTTSSVRTVCSYPLLYDNHHIARRPLPRAPSFVSRSSRLLHSEEVRWTNGGVYGLGSNRNSFVSLQTHTSSHNLEISQNSSRSNLNNGNSTAQHSKLKRATSPRVLSVYDLTENEHLQFSTSHLNDHNSATSTTSKRSVRETKSCNETEQSNEHGSKTRNSTRKLPPVPKRNSTSRERCRELKTQCFDSKKPNLNWSKNAYCEIDPRLPKETSEIVENILYKKHKGENGLNMVDLTGLKSNANPQISEYTKRICERIIQMHSPMPDGVDTQRIDVQNTCSMDKIVSEDRFENSLLQNEIFGSKETTGKQRRITKDSGYDELALCTSGQSTTDNANKNEDKTQGILLEDCCRSSVSSNTKTSTDSYMDQTSFCESITTEEDGGYSDGGDDFEIIYPIVESRRTYPLGAFGSDQYILDSLLEQENKLKNNFVRHTAPPGLENLTVPLSELSTDEEDDLHLQSPKSKTSSIGSMSTVLAKTPDVENDVFVYTMAGESSDVPKITINDEDVFEEEDECGTRCDVGQTQNIKSTRSYQHIKNMYSGFPKSNITPNDENIFDHNEINDTTKNNLKKIQNSCSTEIEKGQDDIGMKLPCTTANQRSPEKKNFQKYRRRRQYWSIELNREGEEDESIVRNSISTQNLCGNNGDNQTKSNSPVSDVKIGTPKKEKSTEMGDLPQTQILPNQDADNDKSGIVKSPSKVKSNNKEVAVQLKHAITNAVLKRSQSSPQAPSKNTNKQASNQAQNDHKAQCMIHLDKNKIPIVKMSSKSEVPVSMRNGIQAQDKSERSSKYVGYFEAIEYSPDDDTDEELLDLGTL